MHRLLRIITQKLTKMKKQAIHKGMLGIITNINYVRRTAQFSKFGKYTPYEVSLNELQISEILINQK